MTDYAVNLIVALLPLTAIMLVLQVNPYHALVIRGILGAVSALIYALLGAADVALTEALVGTLLSVMLYAVAVRSSLVMRLGVLQDPSKEPADEKGYGDLITALQAVLEKHYLRLELVPYANAQALHQALIDREIHASCTEQVSAGYLHTLQDIKSEAYQLSIRVRRLYEIMQSELVSPSTALAYVSAPETSTPVLPSVASKEVSL
ncbi:MAG TPA: DUF4040 domain-containing protein [Trichocoleus sp.]